MGWEMPGRKYVSSATDDEYGYSGDYSRKNDATNWNEFQYRNYDARIGRWLSPDPMNQYHSPYVGMGNNQVSISDPTGLWGYTDNRGNYIWINNLSGNSFKDQLGQTWTLVATSIEDFSLSLLKEGINSFNTFDAEMKQGKPVKLSLSDQIYEQEVSDEVLHSGTAYILASDGEKEFGDDELIIDRSFSAVLHYLKGEGEAIRIGKETSTSIMSTPEFYAVHQKIISGEKDSEGQFSINMTGRVFHVGRTNIEYSLSKENQIITYKLFTDDGFWDPDFIDERYERGPYSIPDGKGPNLERFRGIPYDYIPTVITFPIKINNCSDNCKN